MCKMPERRSGVSIVNWTSKCKLGNSKTRNHYIFASPVNLNDLVNQNIRVIDFEIEFCRSQNKDLQRY